MVYMLITKQINKSALCYVMSGPELNLTTTARTVLSSHILRKKYDHFCCFECALSQKYRV